MLLGRRNHSVRVVGTGLEAVQAWETEHFDVILMDNEMPEMSGVEAVEEIRRLEREQGQHRRIPIVALSASAMIGDRERFIGAGMDSYLAKPFRAEELYAVLQQVTTPASEPTNVLRMRAAG
jgi:CheY-like chemotaxis protein